ncbi:MAG: c-type cytochrome biogenesis protein CcsB [Desulfobacterota bacterium]|nr:c-type cytochrome biogenesis protein CcsB [Thermodesulfobacteriota bacterium]
MLSSKLLGIATFLYLICMAVHFIYLFFRTDFFKKAALILIGTAFCAHTAGLGLRWYESYQLGYGHIPISNFYETLVSLSWTTVIIYGVIVLRYKIHVFGALLFPIVSAAMAYASLSPNVRDEIAPLIPALQSNWLTYHVLTCFFGYSAFAVSFVTSIVYLVKTRTTGQRQHDASGELIPSLALMDDIMYKTVAVGFLLLTVGIITGSVWAHYAWGSYWSWDPKETWSLITWFIYAVFLHARLTRGWRGRRMAVVSIIGFCCVLFTFLGVNYLLSGLHSYAR